jgi:hypothetical protein
MSEMATIEAQGSSDQRTFDGLQASAARCRALADAASDPEVKDALVQLANDIDAALSVIKDSQQQPD